MVLSLQWSTESIDAEPWPYDICESGNRSAQAVRLLMCARKSRDALGSPTDADWIRDQSNDDGDVEDFDRSRRANA